MEALFGNRGFKTQVFREFKFRGGVTELMYNMCNANMNLYKSIQIIYIMDSFMDIHFPFKIKFNLSNILFQPPSMVPTFLDKIIVWIVGS